MSPLTNEQDARVALRIDGREVRAEQGQTLLEAARGIGIEIPTLCHDEATSRYAGCRICVVEVEERKALLPACATRVERGMVVHTASPDVIEARRLILGLILEEHSNDCDECRIRESCALRRLAGDLDVEIVRKDEEKKGTGTFCAKHPPGRSGKRCLSPFSSDGRIVRIRERCILCGRCVRVCAEVQGACAIGFRRRGLRTTIGPPPGLSLKEAGCVLCRKCVDACPTGAIEFRGKKEGE